MTDASLRGLEPRDRDSIRRILEGVGVFRAAEVAIGLELVDETFHPGPSTDYQWLIAELESSVVGFACYGPVPLTEGTFDLYWIAVDVNHQGTNIATLLEASVAEVVQSLGGRWLLAETSGTESYTRARSFYQRRGFNLLGEIPDFYRIGDSRLIFGKRLDNRPEHGNQTIAEE